MIRLSNRYVKKFTQPLIAYSYYIHLEDHHDKIHPKRNRVAWAYMKKQRQQPIQPKYTGGLGKRHIRHIQNQRFEFYKLKILEGLVDKEQQVPPDPLWGEDPVPLHYYQNFSPQQITTLKHSYPNQMKPLQKQIMLPYFQSEATITSMEEVKDVNDLAKLAVHYRLNDEKDQNKWFEIEKQIGLKFYKLTNKSLICFKFAFSQGKRYCTPKFNQIINDLIVNQLPNLGRQDLMHLLYANKNIKYSRKNIHPKIYEQLDKFYSEMSLSEKIDWIFVYVDSRLPFLSKPVEKKSPNQDRQKFNQFLYKLQLNQLNFSSPLECLKFTYALVRAKTKKTKFYSKQILQYCIRQVENFSVEEAIFFLNNLPNLEGGEGMFDEDLFNHFRYVLVENWENIAKIDRLKGLHTLWGLGKYDEELHELYGKLQIEADNVELGYFCELELANSTSREWEIIHRIADVDYIPLQLFQHYKRFYNYMKITTEWNLKPIAEKLSNTQSFFDALRFKQKATDKKTMRMLTQFIQFSKMKLPFSMNVAIKNQEYANFCFPQYQISLDVISNEEFVHGTKELKQSYKAKVTNLQNIGWKHLYIDEEQIQHLLPNQFIEYIQSIPEPFIEEQQEMIRHAEEYRMYELDQMKNEEFYRMKTAKYIELWMNNPKQAQRVEEQDARKRKEAFAFLEKHK